MAKVLKLWMTGGFYERPLVWKPHSVANHSLPYSAGFSMLSAGWEPPPNTDPGSLWPMAGRVRA